MVTLSAVLEAEQGENGIHTWRWPCQRMSETKKIKEGATQWGGPLQSGKVQSARERLWKGNLAWRVRPKPGKKVAQAEGQGSMGRRRPCQIW